MVAFEPKGPQSCRPLSNVSEDNVGIPQNGAEMEVGGGDVIPPELTVNCVV